MPRVSLSHEVEEVASRYRAHADGSVHGAFVIGSAALGDWWPGVSDIDLVALVDSVDPSHDERLRTIHARMRADARAGPPPDLDVVYLLDRDLARPPAEVRERPHHRDGLLRRDTGMTTPVIWHSLAEHGVSVPGADGVRAELGEVWLDGAALRDWCRGNLGSYWRRWAAQGAQPATRGGMALLTDWAVAWCVLGVLRLRYTIDTGTITSKSGAGRWALAALELDVGERALVEQALALRGASPDGSAPQRLGRDHAAERRERVVAFLRRATAEVA